MARNYQKSVTLLDAVTIAGAVTGSVSSSFTLDKDAKYLLLEGKFLYGSGGTTAKFWVQTRVKDGTWRDIANFAFTTAAATKFHSVHTETALAAAIGVSDAALADDTILNGMLGDEIRVKYTTTGTYAGATSITIRASIKN